MKKYFIVKEWKNNLKSLIYLERKRDSGVVFPQKQALSGIPLIILKVILSHKIRIYPNKEQEQALIRACGCARFAYNWAKSEWERQYKAGEKPTMFKIKKLWNSIKKEQFPWIYESPKDANIQAIINLGLAFKNFFKKQEKYPKFKKKGINDSFYLSNDNFRVEDKGLFPPKGIGIVKCAEPLRFIGKIMSGTISRTADKWFISIAVDMPDYHKERTGNGNIGIDLGINSLITSSDGIKIIGFSPLKDNLKRLKRLSRQHSRKQKGSNNRRKSTLKLARLHYKITCQRKDVINKITNRLCRENQSVTIENLNVKGMVKNKKLARSISDCSWGEIRRQLEYKAKIYGTEILIADRFFPSSKICSNCGCIRKELKLSERNFKCPDCGFELDRDINAARNLNTLGYREFQACGSESSGRNSNISTKLCRDEAGICSKTGTGKQGLGCRILGKKKKPG